MENKQRRLSMIVSSTMNNIIGIDDTIPWYIKEDLKHFREVTKGGVLVIGNNTYKDACDTYEVWHYHEDQGNRIPTVEKMFPNTDVIVLSSSYNNETIGRLTKVNTYEDALNVIDSFSCEDKEIFIAGGLETYRLFFKEVYTIYITKIMANYLIPDPDIKVTKFLDDKGLLANNFMPYSTDRVIGVDALNPNWELNLDFQIWKRVKSILTGEIA